MRKHLFFLALALLSPLSVQSAPAKAPVAASSPAASEEDGKKATLAAIEYYKIPADQTAKAYVGIEPTDLHFPYFVVQQIAREKQFSKDLPINGENALRQFENMMRLQFPDMPLAGIMGSEVNLRYLPYYQDVIWLLANHRTAAAQIAWETVIRMKLEDKRDGKPVGMAFLRFNNFIYHMFDDNEDESATEAKNRATYKKALKLVDKVANGYHKKYVKWATTGLTFYDPLAYEAGIRLLDAETLSKKDHELIKQIFALYREHPFLTGKKR